MMLHKNLERFAALEVSIKRVREELLAKWGGSLVYLFNGHSLFF
jgi:hypothetical protein